MWIMNEATGSGQFGVLGEPALQELFWCPVRSWPPTPGLPPPFLLDSVNGCSATQVPSLAMISHSSLLSSHIQSTADSDTVTNLPCSHPPRPSLSLTYRTVIVSYPSSVPAGSPPPICSVQPEWVSEWPCLITSLPYSETKGRALGLTLPPQPLPPRSYPAFLLTAPLLSFLLQWEWTTFQLLHLS